MSLQRQVFLIVAGSLAAVVAFAAAKKAPDRGVRFDSPGVLDLAQNPLRAPTGKAIAIEPLDAGAAAAILAAPAVKADPGPLKFSADEFGCNQEAQACLRAHEAQRLTAADGAVKRLDKRLVVAAGVGQPVVFVDWNVPESQSAEGDFERHWYLGRLAGGTAGYHRIEVEFGHDAPGEFLVNGQNGKSVFVHKGSDLIAPAPDGAHVVSASEEYPPLNLRVAALDASGPRLDLVCGTAVHNERSSAVFKGWKDANTFDFAIESGKGAAKTSVALRATHSGNGWHLASDPAPLQAAGVTCSAP